jgi:hypothetical protein
MKTMMIIVGGVYADYYMVGDEIQIVRVYRGSYTFDDPRMVRIAQTTIRGVNEGWLTIGKRKGR